MRKFYSFVLILTAALCSFSNSAWGETLGPLYDGTNTYGSYVPLDGNNADRFQRVQVIYPKGDLSAMKGKQITKMTFYVSTLASKAWNAPIQVRLAETTDEYFSTSSYKSGEWTTVYDGTTLTATGSTMEITFTTPFEYSGDKNLLFELLITAKTGSYASAKFAAKGGYDYNYSVYKYSTSGTSPLEIASGTGRPMRPKTTFTYEEAAAGGCAKPKALTQSAVSATSATFTWTAGGEETSWQWVCLPAATAVNWSSPAVQTATSATATVTGLSAETSYKFYVRADCGSEQSTEVSKAFTTPCADYATADLPLDQNFNSLTAGTGLIPNCWSKVANGNYPYIYSSGGVDNSKSLYFSGGTSATSSIIILPHFEAPTNTLVISLVYKNNSTNTYYGQFKIGYMTNPEDASTFESLKALTRYTTLTEENKFALTGAPVNSYIAIQYSGGSYSGSGYLDNIKVAVPSSCADPSGVSAVAASATTATVSWTENGSAETWNIQYSTNNFATHTDVNGVTTNPYTLTGLSSNTTYKVRVQADCGSEQSDWIASGEFTTPCEAVNGIGWSANFAGASTGSAAGLPGCWVKNSTNTYPYIYQYGARSNSRCLYFSAGSGVKPIAVLPPFNENTNTLFVTLWYNNAYDYGDYCSESHGQLEIGFMTNPADASTFTAQEVLPRVCTYTQAKVALTNAPERSRVAIRYVGGSTTGYAFVDDIGITAIPSCVAPSGVSGSAISYNSASVSWTENGSATAWKIQYSSNNGVSWSGEISATTNPYTLTGLSGNITYIARVKAECGGDYSDWSANSASFNTPCEPADASDFSETFESVTPGGGNLPDCWQYKDIYTNWGDDYPFVYNSGAYQGSKLLYFYGGGAESVNTVLLPPMDAPLNELTIEFYYSTSVNYSSIVYGSPVLGYIAADGTTFMEIETLAQNDSYIMYKRNLSSVPATAKYIAIRYAKGSFGSGHMYLDNVRVYPTPSCVAPDDITVSNITSASADISWTEKNGKTAWKLQYSTDGTIWTDANGGNNITTNPYTLTGLTANTVYYARVKTDCGSGDLSDWSDASESFRTECAEISSLPWNVNFNDMTADVVPECWDNSASIPAEISSHPEYIWGVYEHSGNKMLRMYNYYVHEGDVLINTPKITLPASPASELSFDYSNLASCGAFNVKISTNNGGSWANLGSYSNASGSNDYTNPGVFTSTVIDLTSYAGQTIILQLYATANYGEGAIFVDNISIHEKPSCAKPANFTTTAVGMHSASFTWAQGDSETSYEYLCVPTGDAPDWSSATKINARTLTVSGLDPETTYDFYVRSWCALDDQSEAVSTSFSTTCDVRKLDYALTVTSGSMPACWSSERWSTGNGNWYTSTEFSPTCLQYQASGSSQTAEIHSAPIDLIDEAVLSFNYSNYYSARTVPASVIISNGSTTQTVTLANTASTALVERTIDLTSVNGFNFTGDTITITFKGQSSTGSCYFRVNSVKVMTKKWVYTNNYGEGNSQWGTAANWTRGSGAPTIEDDVTIHAPVIIAAETIAKAKSVVVDQTGTHTGAIDILPKGELIINGTLRKATGTAESKIYSPTAENDVNIGSSAAGLGGLVIGSHAAANGLNDGTVNFYSLSHGSSGSTASVSQYLGTPFSNLPKMLYQFYNSWVYKFTNTGTPNWERVNGDDGLEAFAGYAVISADPVGHTYWMQGTLVASENQNISLQFNSGDGSNPDNENMLANSWMAPIQIRAFNAATDFTNADATIYIFNSGSPDDYETNNGASTTGALAGQYSAYTPGTAAATDVIPAMQAFSVYTSAPEASIALDYNRLVYVPAVAGLAITPNRAPRRTGTDAYEAGEPAKMRLFVNAASGYGDMLYMLEREDFSEDFENGWDARKMFGESVAPQLYAITPDGNMAINCVPTFEGTILGFRKGANDNGYTFTFDYDGADSWYLLDLKEQVSTLITTNSSYMFVAAADDLAARFIISRTPLNYTDGVATGVDNHTTSTASQKLLIDGVLYIIRNGRIYSAEGALLK